MNVLKEFVDYCEDKCPSLNSHAVREMKFAIDQFEKEKKVVNLLFGCVECKNNFNVVLRMPPEDYLKMEQGDVLLFVCPACFMKSFLKYNVGGMVIDGAMSFLRSVQSATKEHPKTDNPPGKNHDVRFGGFIIDEDWLIKHKKNRNDK